MCTESTAGGDRPPITQSEVGGLYQRPDPFTDLLPWVEYDPEHRAFLLDDGVSVGALFEITPIGTEVQSGEALEELRDQLQNVLTDAIPEEDGAPWLLQFYVQDEPNLDGLQRQLADYIQPRARDSRFTQAYLDLLEVHLQRICQPGGLFEDTAVTGGPWRGQVRRVRAVLYRRTHRPSRLHPGPVAEEALNDAAVKLVSALTAAGFRVRRCDGRDFYEWMLSWFNPVPAMADGDPAALRDVAPYPGDEELPFGYDFAEMLTLSMPRSDAQSATWWFDSLPHKFVTVQGLRRAPAVGHMTAERAMGESVFALFDRLPVHTVMTMTLVIKPQDTVRNHVAAIKRASVGDGAEAVIARNEAEAAELEMARGNKLYPLTMGFFVRGEDLPTLRTNVNRLNALLISNGLQPITEEADLLALDSYVRNLPMAYDLNLDKVLRRSRLVFSRHAANLLPLYGRSRGTGHPGLAFFNRGAEPLVFDPLHPADRKKNAHMLILGPTGAGKSALLVYLLMQMVAVYRPRIFIIEAGNSFGLLGQHFAAHGVTVNQVMLNPGTDVSLPPFGDAIKLAADGMVDSHLLEADHLEHEDDDEQRDLLGEMEIAARIMITGGDAREDARMTRADRLLIRHGILNAARQARGAAREQVLTRDVVQALREIGADTTRPEHRRHRAAEMADGMELFCSGLAGHFFDRPGVRWPDTDVTIVDMGVLAREGYEDQLTVAYIGLMNHINDLVERRQREARSTLVITDEGHVITTNPLLAPYVVKITKMWRKLGTWFWIATQNLEDFPDQSRKMLNMIEWWLCLVMPKEEVDQIARFKELTPEQRALLLAARKESGKYTEGVVLADQLQALFRNVPPPLALALAMTEKHEKAERARIMEARGCSELEAAYEVARRLEAEQG
ncbi:MAG: conjugative transfer ATPase [Gammaproteobacteria bacterium]|nr:conjugative transfer ATPase [Gammaproteobacteria bacterium]